MARIVFEEADGTVREIDIPNGQSVMEGGVRGGIVGIDAECGGSCSCATCMVYVAAEWVGRLPAMQGDEQAMLEFSPHREANSRLSCQIEVSPALEGLKVRVPASQS